MPHTNTPDDTGMGLTTEQQGHFLERGYVVVHDCFSREVAREWTDRAFRQIGYDHDDPQTWKEARVTTFGTISEGLQTFSPRAWNATAALVGGPERIRQPYAWSDAFIFNFWDGADRPWEEPKNAKTNWHVDGNWFRHFLDSPEQGLLTFSIWSDIGPRGGGTLIAPDSVPKIAQFLAERPEGVELHEMPFGQIISECHDLVEITGEVGDVVLCHPFMLHANSQNHSGRPRMINNPTVQLTEPLNFHREASEQPSLVEQAVQNALGAEIRDWYAAGPREHYTPGEITEHRRIFQERHKRTRAAAT